MKNLIYIIIISVIVFVSCGSTPKGFKYKYKGKYTGIDSLININGIFRADKPCYYPNNETYEAIFSFYINGLAHYNNSWGTYVIKKDTIKVQILFDYGPFTGIYVSNRNFLILSRNKIRPLTINGKTSPNAYECEGKFSTYTFYSIEQKVDSTQCPLLKKKWFVEQDK